MTFFDFLDPGAVRSGALGVLPFVVFHAAVGWLAISTGKRVFGRSESRRIVSIAFVVLAPICGLLLANVTYGCSACVPDPDWCVAYSVGLPFRIGTGQHEPPNPPVTDACGVLGVGIIFHHDLSALAAGGDYFIGLVGVAMVASAVGSFRSKGRAS